MTSRAPPASPALIMLTYRRSKALGALAMASESVEPPSISSQTSIRRVLEAARLALVFQNSQAAQDRQAGVLQNRKLPRERGQHLAADAADGERLAFCAALGLFGGGLAALLDGDLGDEVAHLADRRLGFFLAGRLDHVLDLLARWSPSPRIDKLASLKDGMKDELGLPRRSLLFSPSSFLFHPSSFCLHPFLLMLPKWSLESLRRRWCGLRRRRPCRRRGGRPCRSCGPTSRSSSREAFCMIMSRRSSFMIISSNSPTRPL